MKSLMNYAGFSSIFQCLTFHFVSSLDLFFKGNLKITKMLVIYIFENRTKLSDNEITEMRKFEKKTLLRSSQTC